jgi:hypothetical protein
MIHVTHAAIDQYIARIAPVDRAEASRVIHSAERGIEAAHSIGAHTVRLGNGARLVLAGVASARVISVLERGRFNRADVPHVAPVCCGLCGTRCGHPIARACARAECPLPAASRFANDPLTKEGAQP